MQTVRIRYWAGAKAAAGVDTEEFEAVSVRAALANASASRDTKQQFVRVLGLSSILIDGVAASDPQLDQPLAADVQVEVLPPFAGG